MPLDILILLPRIFFSVLDLLKGSLPVFIPVFISALIAGWLRERIAAKTKWNWIATALCATFCLVWVAVLLAYFMPYLTSLQELDVGVVPSMFSPPIAAIAASYIYGILRVTLAAAVLSLILLPFELVGLYIFESAQKRFPKFPRIANIALSCYGATVVGAAVVVFLMPEAVTGLLYFIYFG